MKEVIKVPFEVCRKCLYNDFIHTGVDFCVRGKCRYKVIKEDTRADTILQKEGGKVER